MGKFMTSKKLIKRRILSFQISQADFEKIKKLAEEEDMRVSQIVRRALRVVMNDKKSAAA